MKRILFICTFLSVSLATTATQPWDHWLKGAKAQVEAQEKAREQVALESLRRKTATDLAKAMQDLTTQWEAIGPCANLIPYVDRALGEALEAWSLAETPAQVEEYGHLADDLGDFENTLKQLYLPDKLVQ